MATTIYLPNQRDKRTIEEMARDFFRSKRRAQGSSQQHDEGRQNTDIHLAMPQTGAGIPAYNPITKVPGTGICDIFQIDLSNPAVPVVIDAYPNYRIYNHTTASIPQELFAVGREKYGRWIPLSGTPVAQKARVCMYGPLQNNLLPGEGGLMLAPLVCLWNPQEVDITAPISVLNLTDQTLEAGRRYEACYNCECKFVIVNCCPLVEEDCPNCFYMCADNYDVTIPAGTFSGACSCLNGVTIPYSWDSGCQYLANNPDPYLVDNCTAPGWDEIESNPCICVGKDYADEPVGCAPDLVADPNCRHCGGGAILPCTYCQANCGHGLREVWGTLNCVDNNWVLTMDIGSPGVCPNIGIALTSAAYPYPANGNCPPREMLMDVVVDNNCTDPDLQCVPANFTTTVRVSPRNN